ncbi:MAG TPA: hypothetical protein VKB09_09795, partial [Thermomicrobiales bacterium]|nr:hypothetical protein [Thermomicrobiales bacterium]
AADAAGVDVARTRYIAALTAGAMAGLAGAFLSVADLKIFQVGMTVGAGFIALALTMVGGWNPYRILLASCSSVSCARSVTVCKFSASMSAPSSSRCFLTSGSWSPWRSLPDERHSRRPSGCRIPAAAADLNEHHA